jgi:PAS domain S-box-containing protein
MLGAGLTVGAGVGIAGGVYLRFGREPWEMPGGVVAPLGLAVLLVGTGVWLAWRRVDGDRAIWVAAATIVGIVAFGSFAVEVALDLLPPATTDARAVLVALNFASAGGAVGAVVGLFTARQSSTIRQLRERERDLRQSRDEYRDLFDGIGDAVLVHDTEGCIRAANEAAVDRLGCTEPELVGCSIVDVEENAPDGRTATEDGRLVYEAKHRTETGREVPTEVSAKVVRHRGDRAVLSVARDISDRRASERKLARKRDQLAALNRIVRHDIRNDIQVILTLAEILENYVEEAGREHIDTIVDTSESIVELTRSSGEIARTMADEGEWSMEAVSLAATLETEVDRRANAFDHADIRIVGDLPEVDVLATDLLSSVFRNLLTNAVRHSDRDEPTVEVSAEVDGDGEGNGEKDRVIVRVADDGPGVPDRHKDAIFGKEEKGIDSEGTGLGLYLVASLVGRYDGEVWVEDNEPRGAVFVVELPVAD